MPSAALNTVMPIAPGAPRIIKEKIPAPADIDRATTLTVQKMCEYIRAGAADPIVQAWAAQAKQQFGAGGQTLQSLCWGAWWMVKHRVRFAKDEPRLMGIGDGDALDLLIAPAVLVRQTQPAGDCDDFTMLICALLTILGVPWNIVVIAADPSDPSRWSHVFPVAIIGKETIPLDCSHGDYPGWMVPAEHTFRRQAYSPAAQKVNQQPLKFRGLHGYAPRGTSMIRRYRTRGMGQDSSISSVPTETTLPVSELPAGVVWPTSTPTVTPSTSIPFNWNAALSSILGNAAQVATVAELPPGSTISPQGTVYTGGSPSTATVGTSLGNMLPLLLIGGVAILLFSSMGKR